MSIVATRRPRFYTQAEQSSKRSTKLKLFLNKPLTETLRRQAKIVNPYTQIGSKTQIKKPLIYQRPHSISLISKIHQKAASQTNFIPYVQAEQQAQQKYRLDKPIFKGLNSIVYNAIIYHTSQRVAIKKIPQDPKSKNKQVPILKKINHCNLLVLIDHYYTLQNGRRYLYMVNQLFHNDLYHHIRSKRKKIMEDMAKKYAFQILAGLYELHRAQIVHRDLKSTNIFITQQQDRVVIGDFGSAKQLSHGETTSGEPCPFSYRAPQLLFGNNNYSYCSDIWAFGCILIQLATFSLPFKARNNTQQILQIINLLGTPNMNNILEMNPNYDERQYYTLPKIKSKNIKEVFQLNSSLSDLLKNIFVYSPSKRITAAEALKHEYFKGIELINIQSEISEITDRSMFFTPPSLKNRKEHQTTNTLETYQDESQKDIKESLQIQSSQILLNRNGINIPLKIKRKLQY